MGVCGDLMKVNKTEIEVSPISELKRRLRTRFPALSASLLADSADFDDGIELFMISTTKKE